ncbi:MAG: hypothetical protein ABJE95_38325 [Byssovorax sp.]
MTHSAKAKPLDATFPTVPATAHDVDSLALALGEPDAKLVRLLLRNTREDALAEWGTEVDSRNITADMPRYVVSALGILASLDPVRRGLVKLPPGIFAALVGEAARLESMKVGHDATVTSQAGDKADRESTLRREMREGVALRDTVAERLGNALSHDQMKKLEAIAGDASSADKLAAGLEAIAEYVGELRASGSEDDNDALDLWSIDAATLASLRDKSAAILDAGKTVAPPPRKVSQRSLDIQDGRVLTLVDMIWRAFRLARRTDRSILMPELNRILWMFETRSSTPKGTKDVAHAVGADPKKIG